MSARRSVCRDKTVGFTCTCEPSEGIDSEPAWKTRYKERVTCVQLKAPLGVLQRARATRLLGEQVTFYSKKQTKDKKKKKNVVWIYFEEYSPNKFSSLLHQLHRSNWSTSSLYWSELVKRTLSRPYRAVRKHVYTNIYRKRVKIQKENRCYKIAKKQIIWQ